ncbi:MAG: dethiobiotin synthase [Candidatus Omnitrophota bacterium]
MTHKGLFIAGTDTDIGKTVVTGLLAEYLTKKKISVITQKWVQTGKSSRNDDISCHLQASGTRKNIPKKYYSLMVPYSFDFAASPHLASALEGVKISPKKILKSFRALSENFDIVLVEGTGGLLVPITENELAVDIVRSLDLDVILVIGNRLGAINQALLSIEAIRRRGIRLQGLIFNRFSPDGDETVLDDNRRIITLFSGVEDFGEVPYEKDSAKRTEAFDPIGESVFAKIGNKAGYSCEGSNK